MTTNNQANAWAGFDPISMIPLLMMGGAKQLGESGNASSSVMFFIVLVPLVKFLFPYIKDFMSKIRLVKQCTRIISHSKDTSSWWTCLYDDKDNDEIWNVVIQRAILNYINTKLPEVAKGWMTSEVQGRRDEKEMNTIVLDQKSSSNSIVNKYSQYQYFCVPPNGQWVDLKNGIELEKYVSVKSSDDKKTSIKTTSFTLRSKNKRVGSSHINSFIDKCLEEYNSSLRNQVDHTRYFFTPTMTSSTSDSKTTHKMFYKKYKLSDSRTFESFFHPEKESILRLVDQFSNKTGKFSIAGYPMKLGFLLHGPPGTGKTSFIKALAQLTKRHIINIPLSKINTNQELMNLMFDQNVLIADSTDVSSSASLPHNRCIFVMEDVDAASNVVHKRTTMESKNGPDLEAAMMMLNAMSAEEGSKARSPSDSLASGIEISAFENEVAGPHNWKDCLKDWSSFENDKLNLASLLNMLDGVIDTPERIIVMTTNHPEKLDPALIRPGRINRKIYLGNVKLLQAQSMIRHYFNDGRELDADIENHLKNVFVDDVISPAFLESMCAEHQNVRDLIHELEAKMDN